MANLLTLVSDSAPEFHAYYWEPLIDGLPLRRLISLDPDDRASDVAGLGPAGRNIPVFVHSWPAGLPAEVLVLAGRLPPALPRARAPLFVCQVCGDLGCGALTVAVEVTPTVVTWRDFGWDVNYASADDDVVRYEGEPFVFDRQQYDAEIERFIDTFDEVRSSVPPRPERASAARAHRSRVRSLFTR